MQGHHRLVSELGGGSEAGLPPYPHHWSPPSLPPYKAVISHPAPHPRLTWFCWPAQSPAACAMWRRLTSTGETRSSLGLLGTWGLHTQPTWMLWSFALGACGHLNASWGNKMHHHFWKPISPTHHEPNAKARRPRVWPQPFCKHTVRPWARPSPSLGLNLLLGNWRTVGT